jgi:outer membrane protein assembly factor BamB
MPHLPTASCRARWLLAAAVLSLPAADARLFGVDDDWPEWRGRGRLGVWSEDGILDAFPAGGLQVRWRMPIHAGYAGPSVAAGRVFVTDSRRIRGNRAMERALALDEATGGVLWTYEWEADYTGLQLIYAIGPRATPTVDGERVYVLGAMGRLTALESATGRVVWQKDFVRDFGAEVPSWGMAAAPVVDGERLIALVGGEPDAKVMAFDKHTGDEIWRALSSDWEPGYNQPIIIEAAGVRQLIIWHPRAITALDPATGKTYWDVPSEVDMGMTVATPVRSGSHLLVTSFYNGARMLRLDEARPAATLMWSGTSNSEVETDAIHSTISTPVIDGGYIYGIDSHGELRCLELRTGRRVWESMALVKERARWATAFLVKNGDRYFINNDRGELIIARLSPKGFEEISRTQLIEPTHPSARRRERGAVHWSHPAYANRHVVVRNDKEILRASLASDGVSEKDHDRAVGR